MKSIYDILVEPGTDTPLMPNFTNNTVENINTEIFDAYIENDIPVILPKYINENAAESELHTNISTHFNYIEHYVKDSQEFDYFAEYEAAVTRDEIKRLHQKLLSSIPKNARNILDVGCGNGWLSKALVSDSTNIISMDISSVNPAKALKNTPHKNHFGLAADAFYIPLKYESIDCIVASEIIEHIPNPKLFILELIKLLKPGGKLIISTPYNEKLTYYLCVHCNHPTPKNAHIHSFNERNFKDLIPQTASNYKFHIFGNKHLTKIRFYLLIKFLPFKIWELIDKIGNKIIKSPNKFLIEITK